MNNTQAITSKKGKTYQIIKTLGQGQYGKVYLVVDEAKNEYAMKSIAYEHFRMDAKKIQNLITEQNIMEIVNSPRVLKLYDKIDNGRVIHLITTFCEGGNLEDLILATPKGLGEARARKLLVQIGEAFHEMRRNKIIHRDLKLANIFLKNGDIVIGDFGFAKLGVSITGSKLGTPYYMAPEILNQSSNASKYSSKCDLWSIGVCYYFLIFGTLPFNANSLAELKSKIEAQSGHKLPFLPHQPVSIESKKLLIGLLQKFPADRLSFDQFFEFCGLKPLADLEPLTPGSGRDLEADLDAGDSGLVQRQQQDFRSNDKSGPFKNFEVPNFPKSPEKGPGHSKPAFVHNPTPINLSNNAPPAQQQLDAGQKAQYKTIKQTNKFSISRMNESFGEEESFGYICFKVNQNLQEAEPYVYKINQIVFFFNVLKKIKDARIPSNFNIKNSDFNSLFMLLEVFTARKTEAYIRSFKQAINDRVNIFNIKNFGFFCNSKIYSDLWQVTQEFEDFITGIFEVLVSEMEKENPKQAADVPKIKQLDPPTVEKYIKEQCKIIWRSFQKYSKHLTPVESSCILHIIAYVIYFCQDQLFPVEKYNNHREWAKFNAYLDARSNAEIEAEMTKVFG